VQEAKNNEKHVQLITSYREKIEKELSEICNDVINILKTHLIPKAGTPESQVFYHKMYAHHIVSVERKRAAHTIHPALLPLRPHAQGR